MKTEKSKDVLFVSKNNYENIMYDKRKETQGYIRVVAKMSGLYYLYDILMNFGFFKALITFFVYFYKIINPVGVFLISILLFITFLILLLKHFFLMIFMFIIYIVIYGLDKQTPIRLMS
jgi:hypothetical protein